MTDPTPSTEGLGGVDSPGSDTDIPAIPTPFRPAEPLVGRGSGCGTPMLVGCGLTVLILLIGVGLVLANSQKLIGWAFSQSRQALLEKMPEDLPIEQRQRFERAFDRAVEAVIDQELDQKGLQTLSNELRDAVIQAGDGSLSAQEVEKLTSTLEALVLESENREVEFREERPGPSTTPVLGEPVPASRTRSPSIEGGLPWIASS